MERNSNFIEETGNQFGQQQQFSKQTQQLFSQNNNLWNNQNNLFQPLIETTQYQQQQPNIFERNNNNNIFQTQLNQGSQQQQCSEYQDRCSQQSSQSASQRDQNGNSDFNDEKEREKDMLRQCISQMMAKRQQEQSSKKRKEMLSEHRFKFIEATLEKIQQEECDYFTSEEFEYHVCLNIDRLIKEQEEEDMRKYQLDEEIRKAEEVRFRGQMVLKDLRYQCSHQR